MAKVIYGPIVSEARGKLGDIILNRNRGGNFARALKLTAPGAAAGDGASVTRTDDLILPSYTETIVPFDAELYDVGDLHSNTVNPSRLTVSKAGVYLIALTAYIFTSQPGTNYAYLYKNQATTVGYWEEDMNLWQETVLRMTDIVLLAPDDFLEFTFGNSQPVDCTLVYDPQWTPVLSVQQLTAT